MGIATGIMTAGTLLTLAGEAGGDPAGTMAITITIEGITTGDTTATATATTGTDLIAGTEAATTGNPDRFGETVQHSKTDFESSTRRVPCHPDRMLGLDEVAQAWNREIPGFPGLGGRGLDQMIKERGDLLWRHLLQPLGVGSICWM